MQLQTRGRPIAITAVALLMGLNGLAALVTPFVAPAREDVTTAEIAVNAVFGVFLLIVAWQLFSLNRWAWSVTLAIQIIGALFALMAMFRFPEARTNAFIEIAVAALVSFALTRPHVRAVFARGPTTTTGL
jgi:hypothetical protein